MSKLRFSLTVLFCTTVFLVVCPDFLLGQGSPQNSLRWNHDAQPSFVKDDWNVVYPDFLPRFPTEADCRKYALWIDDAYREDSLKILALFVKPESIPNDLKNNLIAVQVPSTHPAILSVPDLMTCTSIPVREGLAVCWSTDEWSFFYLDTAMSVVLLIQKNPDYSWSSGNEYTAVASVLCPDFADMVHDHSLIEEELFKRNPLLVASLRSRIVSTEEQEKQSPWGLAAEATFFYDSANQFWAFRCDKLLDKSRRPGTFSRFVPDAMQERLSAANRQVVTTPVNNDAPSPESFENMTEKEIMAHMAAVHKRMEEEEKTRRKAVETEKGRLKLIATLGDAKVSKFEKDRIIGALWMVYDANIRNGKDLSAAELTALKKLLNSNDASCRRYGLNMMYSTRPGVIQNIYFDFFPKETDVENRQYIVESLGWKGNREAIPFLESIYPDKNNPPMVRRTAWRALNQIEAKFAENAKLSE